jgi:hypothetical protein
MIIAKIQAEVNPHPIKKGMSNLSLILLILSWPACLIHRLWNNAAPQKVHWFLTDVKKSNGELKMQDIQYYVFDTGNMISASLILLSFIFCRQKTKTYNTALKTIFLISVSDIFHYWYSFKQTEWIVQLQGITMVALSVWILTKPYIKWKKV